MNVVIVFLGWCVLAVISTMRFSLQPQFSSSERVRRALQGDETARDEQERLELAPLLQSFQFIVRTLLVSIFITYCVVTYGVVAGVILGTVLVLLLPIAFRLAFFGAWVDRLRDMSMPWLKKTARTLAPLLKWFQERELVVDDMTVHSQEELLDLVRRSPGVLSRDEHQRLVASLAFDHKTVAEVMTPKSMIDAVPAAETLGPLVLDELYKTGHSRFPVYKKDLDHIVGMLYLRSLVDLKNESQLASEAMQPKAYFIRDDRSLAHALHGFLSTKHHLFVVVNNYRETVGLLSLEDTMEALLGVKIADEFDAFDDLRAVAEHNPKANNEPKEKEDI
jgi:CBS domain containing-hemolysin-like protein